MKQARNPNIIVAYDNNRSIGYEGKLPWQGDLPSDMRHFRAKTIGNIVVMGRVTFDSIGKALPDRENVVISRQINLSIENCMVVHDHNEVLLLEESDPRQIFIVGGGKIYDLYLPIANRVFATEIDATFEADSFFPVLDKEIWHIVDSQDHQADDKNKYNHRFVTYERTA